MNIDYIVSAGTDFMLTNNDTVPIGDNAVNCVDALLALRFALALTDLTDEQQFAADVNTDGKVMAF